MKHLTWHAPLAGGGTGEEMLLAFEGTSEPRLLMLPALFDEANRMRRFTVQAMRALSEQGIASYLPDLPGCNESLAPLAEETLATWRKAAEEAVHDAEATHVLAIRGGALIAPPGLPSWFYAPVSGGKIVRGMVRAGVVAAREAGEEVSSQQLLERGRVEGVRLAGWPIGAAMFRELEQAEPLDDPQTVSIAQAQIPGRPLWLRAEPDEDEAASQELANIVAAGLGG
ncbi:hypothetical protein [Erythrobacter sp.]|jgi:hypothetical protein|uniref:hypothetical protein n=1 Tax=Erythrobacter sp. TaxID=1042 RepID=UPI002E9DD3AF|nr:hypothetical protein [Erythrobacter sp.]